jgi:hypothetical protein
MPNAGNSPTSLANLTERLKSKTEEERQTAERLIETEFESFSANVRESMKNALVTIENAIDQEAVSIRANMTIQISNMASQIRLLNNGFIRHWFVCGLLGLGLTGGLALGGWGLATLAKRHISSLRQNITTLNQQKASLETTLKQLESKTWGLSFIENPEGRFIILPPKAILKTGWTFGKQPAVKLE